MALCVKMLNLTISLWGWIFLGDHNEWVNWSWNTFKRQKVSLLSLTFGFSIKNNKQKKEIIYCFCIPQFCTVVYRKVQIWYQHSFQDNDSLNNWISLLSFSTNNAHWGKSVPNNKVTNFHITCFNISYFVDFIFPFHGGWGKNFRPTISPSKAGVRSWTNRSELWFGLSCRANG